ncbi:MAG: excinuclease ABC subunit UvrC [Armatimonadetes bacterium]|nr:excinuclease ABC subunit UvrC [Armatimonadota bacterium]
MGEAENCINVEEKLSATPEAPGCYLIKDAQGRVLYVGKARSLRHRLRQHFSESRPMHAWHEHMIRRAADFDYIVTASEVEALILEAVLIKKHRPRYNIRLADDKSYPYLVITDEPYPRIVVLRDLPEGAASARPRQRRGLHDPKRHSVHSLAVGQVFGPYADASAMRRTMRLVSRLFGLRTCQKKLSGEPVGQPCLNYYIGRCVGPCTGKISIEEYGQRVREAAMFLRGNTAEVVEQLEQRMREAAERLQFEQAAILRDRIRAIQRVTQQQAVVINDTIDIDVLAAAQEADIAVVSQLVVRAGKLVQQNQMTFSQAERHAPEEAIAAFISHHYAHGGEIPREVLVSHELEGMENWERLLAEMRRGPVRVALPRRGPRKRLVEMALQNASSAVQRLIATHAESKRLTRVAVEELGAVMGMARPPRRIECFDISHTGGYLSVGSMVVFEDGQAAKGAYRRFRVRSLVEKPDDYAAMREVIMRRLQRAQRGDDKFLPLPDLILVDGGRGQLSVAEEVVGSLGLSDQIALAALAKEHEAVYVPGRSEPLDMAAAPKARFLLQRIRDEAHRFAVTHHRALREQQTLASVLDKVPGIGAKRRAELMRAFPSLQAIAEASVDEIAGVPSMTRPLAETVRQYVARALSE